MKKFDDDILKIFLGLSILLSLIFGFVMQSVVLTAGVETLHAGKLLISSMPLSLPYANIFSFLLLALYWYLH